MEHFREVQDGIFLLKSPFPPVWSGVTLVRGEELCLIDSGASADVADGVIRPALAELGLGLGDIDCIIRTACPFSTVTLEYCPASISSNTVNCTG